MNSGTANIAVKPEIRPIAFDGRLIRVEDAGDEQECYEQGPCADIDKMNDYPMEMEMDRLKEKYPYIPSPPEPPLPPIGPARTAPGSSLYPDCVFEGNCQHPPK